jgi:hypothetical protein
MSENHHSQKTQKATLVQHGENNAPKGIQKEILIKQKVQCDKEERN